MGFFKKKEPEVVYIYPDKGVLYCGPGPEPMDGDRKQLWMDVVRVGLGQLVAVQEVLHAGDLVLSKYDALFSGNATPEVPESFYTHDPEAPTDA